MNTGAIFLIVFTVVAISDVFIALRYRQLADRADSGEAPTPGKLDAAGMRQVATFMLMFSPVLFVGAVLISFGVLPVGGIDPIKF